MEVNLNNERLISKAEKIADLIANIDTDDRGVLFSHVATALRARSQNYTATLIYKAAVEYGLPRNCEPDMPNAEITRQSRSTVGLGARREVGKWVNEMIDRPANKIDIAELCTVYDMQAIEIERLRNALRKIKSRACGEALPNWENTPATGASRGWIADVCDIAIGRLHTGNEPSEVWIIEDADGSPEGIHSDA